MLQKAKQLADKHKMSITITMAIILNTMCILYASDTFTWKQSLSTILITICMLGLFCATKEDVSNANTDCNQNTDESWYQIFVQSDYRYW